jgi:hypothetical protein
MKLGPSNQETVKIRRISIQNAVREACCGRINDACSCAAIYRAYHLLNTREKVHKSLRVCTHFLLQKMPWPPYDPSSPAYTSVLGTNQ